MIQKNTKYKLTGIITMVLIILVVVGGLYFNYWYLDKPEIKKADNVSFEILETDVEIVSKIKNLLVEDEEYKALQPIELPEDFYSTQFGKNNPFDVNINE